MINPKDSTLNAYNVLKNSEESKISDLNTAQMNMSASLENISFEKIETMLGYF